jgi:SAM-dependent methyltransferase
MSNETLIEYYGRRAAEYERIYQKPERQADLIRLRDGFRKALAGKRVLELACGTGYWTAAIADFAESVLATDACDEVLEVAAGKGLDPARVSFARADAYRPAASGRGFTAGFAAFWWSHVPKERLASFLDGFHAALLPGARVVFADNRFVEGGSTPVCRTDDAGNTYQLRHLDDGSTHEVLKNFPTRAELLEILGKYGRNVEVVESEYFWCASYDVQALLPSGY